MPSRSVAEYDAFEGSAEAKKINKLPWRLVLPCGGYAIMGWWRLLRSFLHRHCYNTPWVMANCHGQPILKSGFRRLPVPQKGHALLRSDEP